MEHEGRSMTVSKTANGKWGMFSEAGDLLSEHDTHAEAWRAHDRLMNEPVNKREDTADWIFRKADLG